MRSLLLAGVAIAALIGQVKADDTGVLGTIPETWYTLHHANNGACAADVTFQRGTSVEIYRHATGDWMFGIANDNWNFGKAANIPAW